ncbi:MAG: HAMP domain-containing sensor histidine kinase [Candidatus Krumholzibacteriia bacterium]
MPRALRNLLGGRSAAGAMPGELAAMSLLLRLLACTDPERRRRLAVRVLRRLPAELVAAGWCVLEPGRRRVVVRESAGSAIRAASRDQLEAALGAHTGPLPALRHDRPLWLSLREDPFQPGAVFLRKFELEWALLLPLEDAPGPATSRGFLLVGGRHPWLLDHPALRTLLMAWRVYRLSEAGVRAREVGGDGVPHWWDTAPAALAVVADDRVVRTTEAARLLLASSVGAEGRQWIEWLSGAVRRLEATSRSREVVPASRTRQRSLEITLGPLVAALGGRLVGIRDASAEDRASREAASTISTLSHELRTPLTALKNGLDVVLRGDAGPLQPDQERFLGLARRNIERLDRLVSDLLDLTRAQAGRLTLHRHRLDVVPLLRDALEVFAPAARERDVSLELSAPETFTAHVDPDKLHQILDNVVSNALKFTEAGGTVRVWLRERGGGVPPLAQRLADRFFLPLRTFAVVVEDTGVGMDSRLQDEVFQPFRRGGPPVRGGAPGAGLGLHITRGLVEAHGGHIELTSRPAVGTTVWIHLPRDPGSEQVLRATRGLLPPAVGDPGDAGYAGDARYAWDAKEDGAREGSAPLEANLALAALDLRRPDREPAEPERQRIAAVIASFLERLELPRGPQGMVDPGVLGMPAPLRPGGLPVELAPDLFLVRLARDESLAAAWQVELARPDIPAALAGSVWELLPADLEDERAGGAGPRRATPAGAADEEQLRPMGAGAMTTAARDPGRDHRDA